MRTFKRLGLKVTRSTNGKWVVNGSEQSGDKGQSVLAVLIDMTRNGILKQTARGFEKVANEESKV